LPAWIIPPSAAGDDDVAVQGDELVGGDRLDAVEVVEPAAVLQVLAQGVAVDAGLVVDRAERVRDADDLRAEVLQDRGGPGAHVAESLHDDARVGRREAEMRGGLAEAQDDAAPCRGLAAVGAAE